MPTIQEHTLKSNRLIVKDTIWDWKQKTYVMGILNATPDSFSDGGKYNTIQSGVKHALDMIHQGADIIDVGGESTRPNHIEVGETEEIRRVVPMIKAIREKTNHLISIDTYRANTAREALKAGADIVNDVWGLQREPEIANVAAEYQAPVIIMHNQQNTEYENDIIYEIKKFYNKSLDIAHNAGIGDDKIILDIGIGFGKTPEQNIEVLSRMSELLSLGYPLLLGTSRKSVIGYILDVPVEERLEGTIATSVLAVSAGFDVVRVHDVKENVLAVKVADKIVRGFNG